MMDGEVYACFNKNLNIQKSSSSGGIFYLLAQRVISQGGVVFGVRWNVNWEAVFDVAHTEDELSAFLGSKYLPADMNGMYQSAEQYLKDGKKVLYSGTPCQISGLKAYLGKEYDELTTVDMICHGVPSPVVWRQYLRKVSAGQKIKQINFRDKTYGWLDYSLKIELDNGKVLRKPRNYDLFMRGFIKGAFLRPSCYQCCFQNENHESDLTLGDFWKVRMKCEEMYHEEGTSLMTVRTEKGKQLLQQIQDQMQIRKLMEKDGESPAELPPYRSQVFQKDDSEILAFCEEKTRPPREKNKIRKLKKYVRKLIRK